MPLTELSRTMSRDAVLFAPSLIPLPPFANTETSLTELPAPIWIPPARLNETFRSLIEPLIAEGPENPKAQFSTIPFRTTMFLCAASTEMAFSEFWCPNIRNPFRSTVTWSLWMTMPF